MRDQHGAPPELSSSAFCSMASGRKYGASMVVTTAWHTREVADRLALFERFLTGPPSRAETGGPMCLAEVSPKKKLAQQVPMLITLQRREFIHTTTKASK